MCEHREPQRERGPAEGGEGAAGPEAEYTGYFPTFRRIGRGVLRRCPAIGRVCKKVARGLVKALLIIVIVLAVVDIVATVYLGRDVRSELQKVAASGGIVNFMDGVPASVPESENAAPLYLKAAEILERKDKEFAAKHPQRVEGERYHINFADPTERARLTPMLRQDADVLELLRRAATMPKCRFDTNWEDVFGALFPHYAKMRRVARFLRAAVVEAALRGDGAEALERARIGFVLSRRMLNEPILIAQLVAYAIDAIVERGVMCVVEKGQVPEEAAKRLAEELAKDDLVAFFVKGMQMERAGGIWFFDQMRRSPRKMVSMVAPLDTAGERMALALLGWRPGRPLLYANELAYLRMMEKAIQKWRKPWREAGRDLDARLAERAPRWAFLADIIAPVLMRAAAKRDQAIAMRAMMVTALAIEVYRQKRGHLPESLAALKAEVPWATTEDVFSGQALVYRPKDGGYLLYSIGPNLKDDGGDPMEWQKELLGVAPPRVAREPDPGDLVWLPQLWRGRRGR